jgi:hypothetical protein
VCPDGAQPCAGRKSARLPKQGEEVSAPAALPEPGSMQGRERVSCGAAAKGGAGSPAQPHALYAGETVIVMFESPRTKLTVKVRSAPRSAATSSP